METEKHHRTTSNNSSTSELFVCFTSRLSSSSMKLSSKSILSPSRSRDQPQISLSSSLSRRLKSNGSMKGGQASPMFPTGGKKRGCGFENPEPSSPKVTCIGQVRVKTKKQGKKMRSRSKRRGEASFRRGENNPDLTRQNSQSLYQNHQNLQQECLKHRNQRWVHLPLTICEAVKEFSCFFPCKSSCMSNEREKEEKGSSSLEGRGEGERSGGGHGREGSCGAAFARWLVAYDGKGRDIEVMMEHHEEMEMEMDDEDDVVDGREKSERSYSQRRHIFEDLDIDLVDEKIQQEEFEGEEEEEEVEEKEKGRVSICVPPKNALLLMRCRSDPVKMAALANRFWESPIHKEQDDQQQQHHHQNEVAEQEESSEDEDDEQEQEGCYYKEQNIEMEQVEEKEEEEEEPQQLVEVVERMLQEEEDSICGIESKRDQEVDEETTKEEEEKNEDGNDIDEDKDETFTCVLLDSSHADLEKQETEETHQEKHEEKQENQESSELSSSFSSSSSTSPETFLASSEQENDEQETESENAEKVSTEEEQEQEQEEKVTIAEKEQDPTHPEMGLAGSMEQENGSNGSKKEERERETLPECLLLMMCEPKLSMEVSKETWVCSTDFIRWLPERPVGKVAGGEKKVTVESSSSCAKPKVKVKTVQPLMQPPRSSCSFPVTGNGAGMSMATMIEQKLVGCSKSRNGYEPFVLKRCKSEPMRSATKLAPEACFWNNRKLELHPPPASLGVGAPAGVGF